MSFIDELDTPSLLLDIDKMTRNVDNIFTFARANKVKVRPHMKTHKSTNIARMFMEKGAVGMTCAKLSEAEVMAEAGVKDILIAYPLSSLRKLERLHNLTKEVNVKITIDSIEQARLVSAFFKEKQQKIEVWIKVNSGLNRCGVEPGEEALLLAKEIQNHPFLYLTGIFTHAGHSYGASSLKEIQQIGIREAEAVIISANLCEEHGIVIHERSVGSTPTYQISGKVEGITEVRPGNAVFFDAVQVGLEVTTLNACALTVLSTVVGKYQSNRLVLDAGSKTLSLDKGAHGHEAVQGHGIVVNHPELVINRLSEEHGIAHIKHDTALNITDKVMIIPNHACTVANLFDSYIVHRNGEVLARWPIEARGHSQ